MAPDRIEIVERIERVERIECVERVERIERLVRVEATAPASPHRVLPSTAVVDVADVIDADPSPRPAAPRGLVLNGVWVPLAD